MIPRLITRAVGEAVGFAAVILDAATMRRYMEGFEDGYKLGLEATRLPETRKAAS